MYYKTRSFPCVCEDRLYDCEGSPLDDDQLEAAARRSPTMEHFIKTPDQMEYFLTRYAQYLTGWNIEHPRNPIDINRIIWTSVRWRHLNNPTCGPYPNPCSSRIAP